MRGKTRVVWMIGAWVAATAATAAVALAVVGLAGDQVADSAVRPLSVPEVSALGAQPAPVPATTAAATGDPIGTTAAPDQTSSTDPGPPTTSAAAPTTSQPGNGTTGDSESPAVASTTTIATESTTTTTVPGSSTTTSVPGSSSTTTTTTVATSTTSAPQVRSTRLTGGTVVVRWTEDYVELVSASPADGFSVDVDKAGPERVEVEFEGDGVKSIYKAEISDGELVIETNTESEED